MLAASFVAVFVVAGAVSWSRRRKPYDWAEYLKVAAPFKLLLTLKDANAPTRGIPCEAIHVSFDESHDRKQHHRDFRIDECWDAKCATGTTLFDKSKFRLRSIAWTDGASCVRIELGLTGYKEYIGTHRLPEAERIHLEADGLGAYNDPKAHLSCALGCEAVLLTSDSYVVHLRRSNRVATNSAEYNGPSGHPEPDDAGLLSHMHPGSSKDVERGAANELYDSVLAEVHLETRVPKRTLSQPLLIGAMEDNTRKPDLIFLVCTSLDRASVAAAYAQGPEEGWESDRLSFWALSDIKHINLPLTPVTRAALECLEHVRL